MAKRIAITKTGTTQNYGGSEIVDILKAVASSDTDEEAEEIETFIREEAAPGLLMLEEQDGTWIVWPVQIDLLRKYAAEAGIDVVGP